LKARRKPGFFLERRSSRKRDHARLHGVARHAFERPQVGVFFGRMGLDADEPGTFAACGAGRTEIGRAIRQINCECAHENIMHDSRIRSTNTFVTPTLLENLQQYRKHNCRIYMEIHNRGFQSKPGRPLPFIN
jgi:hypothetical protein